MPLTLTVRIAQVTTQVDVDDKGEPIYGYISTPSVEITPEWKGVSGGNSSVTDDAPFVASIQSTLNMDVVNGDIANSCSGRVSLTFNDYLYYSDDATSSPTLHPLDRGPIISSLRALPEYENFRAVASLMQARSSPQISLMEDDESQIGKRAVTIEFLLNHAESGTFMTFSPKLCDQRGNVRTSPLTLTVRIAQVTTQVDVDDKGEPIYGYISAPRIEITPEWNGAA